MASSKSKVKRALAIYSEAEQMPDVSGPSFGLQHWKIRNYKVKENVSLTGDLNARVPSRQGGAGGVVTGGD